MYGTLGVMDKTTVYLTTAQRAALARAAAAEGRSEASLIRRGIEAVTMQRVSDVAPPYAGEPAADGDRARRQVQRPRWISRDELARLLLDAQADPGLREELRLLAPDTTDAATLE
jgi:hypothetical protein